MKKIILILSILLVNSCAYLKKTDRPLDHKKEVSTKKDTEAKPLFLDLKFDANEDWNTLSHYLNDHPFLETLNANLPNLKRELDDDKNDPYLLMLWGESKLKEKNKEITSFKIVESLNTFFNRPTTLQSANAGIMHTYAYLFSTLKTPYGYKRERWLDNSLTKGLGLTQNYLSPLTKEGTLLSNLTYLIGSMALRDTNELQILKNVASEIKSFPHEKLKKIILKEKTNRYVFKTVLIEFKELTNNQSHLLIYTFEDLILKKEVLITAFPINQKSFNKLIDEKHLGASKVIVPRYNIFIQENISTLSGERSLVIHD